MLTGGTVGGVARLRIASLVIGVVAALALVVVGCTTVTDGTPAVDANDAPSYRASISASVSASAATSSQREAKRQESLTAQAVHNSCDALSESSVDTINAVNAYVGAINAGGGEDADAKQGPAIDALHRSADLVSTSLTDALSPELRASLVAWVDSARALAQTIVDKLPPEQFNPAIDKLNQTRDTALNMCDAAY